MYTAVLALALAFTTPALAQQPSTAGEIRKVDRKEKTLTIKHARMEKFDMPAMTMEFYVSDPAMLDQVKKGDRIRFDAEKVRGGYAVTRIEKAK